jgi:peptidyl-tRNA hydrolase, PTH1 family
LRAVVGLGNLGKRYELTRHNVGFLLVDYFSDQFNLIFKSSKLNYFSVKGELSNFPYALVKPTTYMNLSGIAVSDIMKKYKITTDDLLILHDDIDLKLGEIKIKQSGTSGGHNGISSIIEHLNSQRFPRMRIGIGREFNKGEMVDYVLDKFSKTELEQLNDTFKFGCELIEKFITGGNKLMLDYFSTKAGKLKDNSIL